MTDFLDVKQTEIAARMKELLPAVDEYGRLKEANAALAKLGRGATAPVPAVEAPRKKPGGRPGRKKVASAAGKVGRPSAPAKDRGGRQTVRGARTAQALALVREQPGITTAELGLKMGIKSPYLYSLLPRLATEGKVEKKRVGWHPKGE